MYANYISYFDKQFSTDDALRIGRLQCFKPDWERASISFLKSGGFVVSRNVPRMKQPTLVLWGRDDKILNLENAYKFDEQLQDGQIQVIPECGHVPHVEKSDVTAELIMKFLSRNKS